MRTNKRRRTLRKSFLVLVDGESEQIYLNSIKTSNIHIKPELPKKKSLEKMYQYFQQERKNHDKTFWIIDLDVPIREEKVHLVKEYKQKHEKEILINHPCLEFWFLLHYELKNFGYDCSDIIRYLKKNFSEFKTYDKSEKEAKKVTDKLKDKLQIAIEHAKKRDCNFESLINCSEMYRLFEKIESIKS
jgi:hypothetical protein